MLTQSKTISYQEYLDMPEINRRYEIIDGELRMSPTPSWLHQKLVRHVANVLEARSRESSVEGEVNISPYDVVIETYPGIRTRQPDVFFVSKETLASAGWDLEKLRTASRLEFAPNLVVEILSPEEPRAGKQEKLVDYFRLGVQECWLLSPEAETAEVLVRGKTEFETSGIYGSKSSFTSAVLKAAVITVLELFNYVAGP